MIERFYQLNIYAITRLTRKTIRHDVFSIGGYTSLYKEIENIPIKTGTEMLFDCDYNNYSFSLSIKVKVGRYKINGVLYSTEEYYSDTFRHKFYINKLTGKTDIKFMYDYNWSKPKTLTCSTRDIGNTVLQYCTLTPLLINKRDYHVNMDYFVEKVFNVIVEICNSGSLIDGYLKHARSFKDE